MKLYDMKCPICGKMNHHLYLEETDGWMECEYCGHLTKYLRRDKQKVIPVYTVKDLSRQVQHSNVPRDQEGSRVSGL